MLTTTHLSAQDNGSTTESNTVTLEDFSSIVEKFGPCITKDNFIDGSISETDYTIAESKCTGIRAQIVSEWFQTTLKFSDNQVQLALKDGIAESSKDYNVEIAKITAERDTAISQRDDAIKDRDKLLDELRKRNNVNVFTQIWDGIKSFLFGAAGYGVCSLVQAGG